MQHGHSDHSKPSLPRSLGSRLKKLIFGSAKNLHDPSVAHHLSLMAFLAWVGLGADGLSSSAYGPEEAFRMLGEHTYLAVFLVLATAATVFIISYAYSRIIEHFPSGGGGYVVATELLGKPAGVVSGCALIVDYILTITVSIAGGGDALFSLLPPSLHHLKLPVEFGAILFLMVMNLRGVKESVTALIPVFLTFVVTHLVLILAGAFMHLPEVGTVAREVQAGLQTGMNQLGAWGLFLVFLHAYSMGAGTYTGIEAVSNGVGILRQPRVETGKRTMKYMAFSLAFIAGGLLLCYMLIHAHPVEGQTLNAVLARDIFGGLRIGGWNAGYVLVLVTMLSEAILLLVAAQTGFIDGPRVMANMAGDNWMPRRFAALSDRLTSQNGILLFGISAMVMLAYTRGHIGILVVMYSVNVFVTFSLSEAGMIRFWLRERKKPGWLRDISVHLIGFVLCFSILVVMIVEKFSHGAWLTVVITFLCVAMCFMIRRHYYGVALKIKEIGRKFEDLPGFQETPLPEFDPEAPTAAILVGGYSGLGIHILLNIFKYFPDSFKNVVFLSVGVVTADFFKGEHHVENVSRKTEDMLRHYSQAAEKIGIPARYEFKIGTEVVETASELCVELAHKYPRAVFFAGELVFEQPQWYHRILHNETAYAILGRIRFAGVPMVILPVRLH